jgi:glyoxylase-like metal-dependent hydrolase (beta-lactamase superfamily II)
MPQSQTHSVVTIPCRTDNYAFLIGNLETREAALVDVPEAAPILAELDRLGWTLTTVLLTHHHYDHVDGLPELDHLGDLTYWISAARKPISSMSRVTRWGTSPSTCQT